MFIEVGGACLKVKRGMIAVGSAMPINIFIRFWYNVKFIPDWKNPSVALEVSAEPLS